MDGESGDDSTSDDDEESKHEEKPKLRTKPEKAEVVIHYDKVMLSFSPPSSPTAEHGEGESYFPDAVTADVHQVPTPVQKLVKPLVGLIRAEADKALITAADDALVDHLHSMAVMLADAEVTLLFHPWNPYAQLPLEASLSWRPRVMG
jgi:hypothetical protein